MNGSSYSVSISTQPSLSLDPPQLCIVTNPTGTLSANVTNVFVECGTAVSYPVPGTQTIYNSDVFGSVAGWNNYFDISIANRFTITGIGGYTRVIGVLVYAFTGVDSGIGSPYVDFNVWADDGASLSPSSVYNIGTQTLSTIETSMGGSPDQYIYQLSTPIDISSFTTYFYAGFSMYNFSTTGADSFEIYTNTDGDTVNAPAWTELSDTFWYPFTDATFNWGIDVQALIYPIMLP